MNTQTLALAFLAATTVGGLAWVFLYPMLSGEQKAESRRASVAKPEPSARQVDKTQRSRREQVEGTLKELDARRLDDDVDRGADHLANGTRRQRKATHRDHRFAA